MVRLILFGFCLFLLSCAGDKAVKDSDQHQDMQDSVANVVTFVVNGQDVKTTGWNIARFKFANMAAPGLNITSNFHEEKRTVRFNLADYQPGIYSLNGSPVEGGSYGSYMPDYWQKGVTYPIIGGKVILTEVDTVRKVVNGSFYFTAARNGDTVHIEDGRIIKGKMDLGISGMGK